MFKKLEILNIIFLLKDWEVWKMKTLKIKGIVMGEVLYGESSKILKIFTEDLGIISVMSRGCRRIKMLFMRQVIHLYMPILIFLIKKMLFQH